MTSYFVDVRFERQLDDDLPIVGLTDEQAKNGKILGGHLVRQFVGELQESYNYGGLAGTSRWSGWFSVPVTTFGAMATHSHPTHLRKP
jgi:hypothetical protein